MRPENPNPDVQRDSPDATERLGSVGRSPGGSRLTNGSESGTPRRESVPSGSPVQATAGREADSNSSSNDSGAPWPIHYSGPPASAALMSGQIPWDMLTVRLKLADETVGGLKYFGYTRD